MLFSSNPNGEFDLYTIPLAGGKATQLTTHPSIDICGSFTLDGQWIYFASMRSGRFHVWKIPASGGDAAAVQVTQAEGGGVVVSPDGKYLYYNPPSILAPVWRVPISGGTAEKVLDGMVWFNYSVIEKGRLLHRPAGARVAASVYRLCEREDVDRRERPRRCEGGAGGVAGREDDYLYAHGFFRRRPDAGGELPVSRRP
jgi:hypothetical protein